MKSLTRIWLFAAWWGLATGLVDVLFLFRDRRLGRIILTSHAFYWITPLADLMLFGVLASVLTVGHVAMPRVVGVRAAAGGLISVAALSILTHIHGLAWWAMVALAIGIGAQLARLITHFQAGALRFTRLTLPVLLAAALAGGMFGHWHTARADQRSVRSGPIRPGAPNVLLIIWDAVRASDLSLYGYARNTTPHLNALARRGVTFDWAMSPASYTLPSHASLFTGRWPRELSASWAVELDDSVPTLAQALGAAGYRTGAFSANHTYVSWEYGLLRGFAHRDDYVLSPMAFINGTGVLHWLLRFKSLSLAVGLYDEPERRYADNVQAHFLDWLSRGDGHQPFFAFLNVFDAHEPYLPPAPFDSQFGWPAGNVPGERTRLRRLSAKGPWYQKPAAVVRLRDLYDGAIAEMDDRLGKLLDALKQRGLLDNTLVIVASDHGEAFREHRMVTHGNSLYMEEVRTPLVMVLPGVVPADVRVSGVTSLRDVSATIAELVGAAGPFWPLPGRSQTHLWSHLSPEASDTVLADVARLPRGGEPWYPVRRGPVSAITAWPYHLIVSGAGLELFDLSTDPGEQHDLAQLPASAARRDALHAALVRWRTDAAPSAHP